MYVVVMLHRSILSHDIIQEEGEVMRDMIIMMTDIMQKVLTMVMNIFKQDRFSGVGIYNTTGIL
jgi:hypothetical protein